MADWVAKAGKLGTVRHDAAAFLRRGRMLCTLCLLGYDPAKYHPGRAPLEAAAQGLKLDAEQDWVFRCNLVTIIDGVMMDHSAGHIGDKEARLLLEEVRKHLGGGSRHHAVDVLPRGFVPPFDDVSRRGF